MRMSRLKLFRDVCAISTMMKCTRVSCCCVLAISYNTPRISPCATWSSDGITFINSSTGISNPDGILVTVDDTVYVAMAGAQQVHVWTQESGIPTMNLSTYSSPAYDIFATIHRDIFFPGGTSAETVVKWAWNANGSVTVMNINKTCYGLFVDVMDNLYCSFQGPDQVVRKSPNAAINSTVVVAGSSTAGSAANMLNGPRGIFVDTAFVLYVADCYNNRVQRFSYGQSNGMTVAGTGAIDTISLSWPHDVILDGNGYLYIAEYTGNRIVASGPHGFRCIIGCTSTGGAAANQLNQASGLSFDSHGNLFVTDCTNNRIQKFLLSNKSCGKNKILSLSWVRFHLCREEQR
jgi:NHL repeat